MGLSGQDRRFLFLQGPHGPFFHALGRMLERTGAQVWRVGFNRGDRAFWPSANFIPFKGTQSDWPAAIRALLADRAITDVVLYDDTRFIHAEAVRAARAAGVHVHVFEEGYLRPYWVTYERGWPLLTAAAQANPDARLIYKPHPDVEAGLRPGRIAEHDLAGLADFVAHKADPVALMAGCDEVWTMTSLLGFEALCEARR